MNTLYNVIHKNFPLYFSSKKVSKKSYLSNQSIGRLLFCFDVLKKLIAELIPAGCTCNLCPPYAGCLPLKGSEERCWSISSSQGLTDIVGGHACKHPAGHGHSKRGLAAGLHMPCWRASRPSPVVAAARSCRPLAVLMLGSQARCFPLTALLVFQRQVPGSLNSPTNSNTAAQRGQHC